MPSPVVEDSRPSSGPPDVPVALVIAARNGDPGAFARFVEHWDPHVRPFVHHTLAGDGSTDRVLAAAYVRAFRGLPRYRASQTPGLWLHRVAYLAVVDELRRLTRDPMRRRARAHPAPRPDGPDPAAAIDPEAEITTDPENPSEPDLAFDPGVVALRRLAPDQRALAVLVDGEGFATDAVASAFDTAPGIVANRLGSARRVLSGVIASPDLPGSADEPHPEPRTETGTGPEDVPEAEGAAGPESADADADGQIAYEPNATDPAAEQARADAVRTVLAALPVPEPGPLFWTELGRRLLAERERPAAPTPDPVARLARAHPAEAGFHPTPGPQPDSVTTMATRASKVRPRRRWGRALAIVAGIVVVIGVITGAVLIGISGHPPDGSISGAQMGLAMSRAFRANHFLTVHAEVDTPAKAGRKGKERSRLVLSQDGSWLVSRTDTIEQANFSSTTGSLYRLVVVPGSAGSGPVPLAGKDAGLATGGPDPSPQRSPVLDELAAAGALIRSHPRSRGVPTHTDGEATWTYRRTVATGAARVAEEWAVSIRRSDGYPIRIERRRAGALVRRLRFSRWHPAADEPVTTFGPVLPAGTTPSVTKHGFARTDLDGVNLLGEGAAVTPAWLPAGFELSWVAVRPEAPAGEPTTGGGANPPDVSVASLGYQRGPERITVTTRTTTAPASDWSDPFAGSVIGSATATGPMPSGGGVRRTLGDGRYNQTPVRISTDAVGRAQLWGISDHTVLTVSGDLTADEAFRLAASLR